MEQKKRKLIDAVVRGLLGMIQEKISSGSRSSLCCQFPQIGTSFDALLFCEQIKGETFVVKAGICPKGSDRLRFCILRQGTVQECISWLEEASNQEILYQTLERLTWEQLENG